MTVYVPHRRIAHLSHPWYHLGNSDQGDEWAVANGYEWTDNDMQPAKPELVPFAVSDRVDHALMRRRVRTIMNAHWPMLRHDGYVPHTDRRKVSDLTPAQLKQLVTPDGYRMRTILESLDCAHTLGLKRELEAKALMTLAEFRVIAAHAEYLWGDDWREHVNVKCLTTLTWRRNLRRAHAAGFPTIALCRGRWVNRNIQKPYVTYTRGNARAQKGRA